MATSQSGLGKNEVQGHSSARLNQPTSAHGRAICPEFSGEVRVVGAVPPLEGTVEQAADPANYRKDRL